jgi:hypothetical protein
MGFTIGKRMTAYPPRPTTDISGQPFLTGGIPKVGSTLTVNTGQWRGSGSMNPRFQWYSGGSSILNATNQSFSLAAAGAYNIAARMSMGNATWGTSWKEVSTGTVAA